MCLKSFDISTLPAGVGKSLIMFPLSGKFVRKNNSEKFTNGAQGPKISLSEFIDKTCAALVLTKDAISYGKVHLF